MKNLVTRYSIIDQFWVSSTIDIANACVIPTDLTDHFLAGLTVNLGFHSLRDKPTHTYSKRPLSDAGKNAFRIFLSNIDVSFHENHNLNMTSYMNDLMGSYNTAFPPKKIQKKPPNCVPWISERLKLCIRKKSKLYKLYVSGRVSRLAYTSFRNRLTAVLRRAKRLYYVKLFYNAGFASKQIWHVINSIIVKKKCQKLEGLEVNGTSLTGLPLVNYINRYFASAALTVTRGLTPPLDYPFLTPPVLNTCFFIPTTPIEVGRVILNLKNKGSKIHLPSVLIKENKDIFSVQLSICYNNSLDESILSRCTEGWSHHTGIQIGAKGSD